MCTLPLFEDTHGLWAGEDLFAFFRHEFTLPEDTWATLSAASLSVTAVSPEPTRQFVYNMYINGTEVGVGPSRLGKTMDGQEILYVNTYDALPLLRAGRNCLGAIGYTTEGKGFLCQLTLWDKEGKRTVLCNSGRDAEAWRVLGGDQVFRPDTSIGTHYYVAHACHMNASRYPQGFGQAGFDDSTWTVPARKEELSVGRMLLPAELPPVYRHGVSAERITVRKTACGDYLIDLGEEIVGGFGLDITCDTPATLTLSFGEELVDAERVKYEMRTGNVYREVWDLVAGRNEVANLSMMTYRYVQISGCPVALSSDMVKPTELRVDFDEDAASFSSDHELLNEIYSLVKHTVKVTTQDLYVDSQSRERGAYEGDLLINLMAAYACGGDPRVGRFTIEYLCTHRTWPAEYPFMTVMAAWAHYMAMGDVALLHTCYLSLEAMVTAHTVDVSTGLVPTPSTSPSRMDSVLVDWPATERDGYDMNLRYNTVFNALYVRACRDLASMAVAVGREAQARALAETAETVQKRIIELLYDSETGGFFDGCYDSQNISSHQAQHATAFCLSCGICADKAMADRMADFLDAQGVIRMSVYGAYFLLEGLYASGHGEIANRLMLSEDVSEGARTWAYMIRTLGATVTTEAWNTKNKGNMTFSHPWGAAPAHMIVSGIFGISPTSPAYEAFDIRPCPHGIGQASLILPTVRGSIKAAFEIGENEMTLSLAIPDGTRATVYLPAEYGNALQVNGVKQPAVWAEGCLRVTLDAGRYELRLASEGDA